jgi:hypothetical protein
MTNTVEKCAAHSVDRFRMLRGRMVAMGVEQAYLARLIHRGKTYVSERMNSKAPWDLDDIYAICVTLDIPNSEVHLYFPPAVEEQKSKKGSARNGTGPDDRDRQPAAAHLKKKRYVARRAGI